MLMAPFASNGTTSTTPPPAPTIEDAVWRALATTPGLSGTRPAADDVARRVTGLRPTAWPKGASVDDIAKFIHDDAKLVVPWDDVQVVKSAVGQDALAN